MNALTSRLLSAALIVAASAPALALADTQQADQAAQANKLVAEAPAAAGRVTRDQVRAELIRARKAGELDFAREFHFDETPFKSVDNGTVTAAKK